MDKDPTNKSGNEEEFSFVEDQEAPSYTTSAPKTDAIVTSGSSPRKKIFILIGFVIALFCLYKLYGLFSTTATKAPTPTVPVTAAPSVTPTPTVKPTVAPQPEPAVTTAATLPVPSVAPEDAPTPAIPKITQTPATTPTETVPEAVATADKDIKNLITEETEKADKSADDQITADKLNKLEQAISENGNAAENLQQQIGGLTNAISGIQDNIAQLTQQINTLSDQMKKPQPKSTPVVVVHKTKVTKRATKPKTSVYVPSGFNGGVAANSMYFVKAMIQGRAWLISPDGATFTISSGDNLPRYGQVLSINPDRGVVMTSSGRVIDYMPQDR